jgi:hypothetical protein
MKAIDVTCPTCGAWPGLYCAQRYCQARINAAVKATRDANRARREAAGR